jgi:hypothetical protein
MESRTLVHDLVGVTIHTQETGSKEMVGSHSQPRSDRKEQGNRRIRNSQIIPSQHHYYIHFYPQSALLRSSPFLSIYTASASFKSGLVCKKTSPEKRLSPEKTKESLYKCSQNTYPFQTNPMPCMTPIVLLMLSPSKLNDASSASMWWRSGIVAVYHIFEVCTRGSLITTISLV